MAVTSADTKVSNPTHKAKQPVRETKQVVGDSKEAGSVDEGLFLHRDTLEWIERRSHVSEAELVHRFPDYRDWKYGRVRISSDEIHELADFTYEPYPSFIGKPIIYEEFVTDFRTSADRGVSRDQFDFEPSLRQRVVKSDLQRDWLREFREEEGDPKVEWVGRCLWPNSSPAEGARILAELLDIDRSKFLMTSEFLSKLVSEAERLGVLVQSTNVATRREGRPLDLDVFNSFQLFDEFVPLVFLHSDTSDEAQVFVLVHSLAHLLLGETGVCLARVEDLFHLNGIELWCSQVALEFLAPEKELLTRIDTKNFPSKRAIRLASHFRVDPFFLNVRLRQLDLIGIDSYQAAYKNYIYAYYDTDFITDRYFRQESRIRGVGLPFAKAIAKRLYDKEISLKEAWRELDQPHDQVHRLLFRFR